ncbi:MAG: hypothetical protein HC769_06925 [Cyanobacteria bacterium CRU_2_1]|nr:hypothetical protein [Cyanobacteria bacterium RU_5_0]NJR58608.1 hypothetical protein [Cyanobacteria bacterium CRU_2_1]
MQAKKASNSRSASTLASRTLKTVGIVVTLYSLLDIVLTSMPYQILDPQWQVNFTTLAVDRGIVPLIGIVLFLTGFWIDSSSGMLPERKSIWQDPRLWGLIFASILGAFFLVLFPLHLNNVRLGYQSSLETISQQVTDAQTQLPAQVTQEIESQRQQINLLLPATDEQLNELIQANRLTQEQADLIRKFKQDPSQIEVYLKQKQDEMMTQLQTQVGIGQEQLQQQLQTEALKSGLRVSIGSLLLSIGFIVIGWMGLRNLRQM